MTTLMLLSLALAAPIPAGRDEDRKFDESKLEGVWKVTKTTDRDGKITRGRYLNQYLVIMNGEYVYIGFLYSHHGKVAINVESQSLDLHIGNGKLQGESQLTLYRRTGDSLEVPLYLHPGFTTINGRINQLVPDKNSLYELYAFEKMRAIGPRKTANILKELQTLIDDGACKPIPDIELTSAGEVIDQKKERLKRSQELKQFLMERDSKDRPLSQPIKIIDKEFVPLP